MIPELTRRRLLASMGALPVLLTAWWMATFPGIVLTLTVLAIYFFGDGLRDVLDPRLRL